jgi:C4-dicarboxylate-specific signal transduction histidine kinase
MAEVATSVLHNVGNVLNSVNVSAALAVNELRASRTDNVLLAASLMKDHAADLGHFMTHDPKGRQLPAYLATLGECLIEEKRSMLREMESLVQHIEHINYIVATQQTYARIRGVMETVRVTDLIEDAFRMNLGALERHNIRVSREYDVAHAPEITVEKHKVLQILVNLVSNAKYACSESNQAEKRLTIRVTNGHNRVKVSVADNGVGIPGENLTRIFNHGFTTRKNGHGFGLHNSALAAQEMGGALLAQSDGPGRGATFTLELPVSKKE